MRKNFTRIMMLLSLLIATLLNVGCSKDEEVNLEYMEAIIGKWQSSYHLYNGESAVTTTYVQMFTFREGGEMTFDIYTADPSTATSPNATMEGTYSIYGNTLTIETSIYYKEYTITLLEAGILDLTYPGTTGGVFESRYILQN